MVDHTPTPKQPNEIPWSHSALESYRNCPFRYLQEKVTKTFKPDFSSPHLVKGNDVHKALEDYVAIGRPIKKEFEHYKPWADRIIVQAGRGNMEKNVEIEMCFDSQWRRASWFGNSAWMRCKADVLLVNTTSKLALNVDYKTNKKYYGEKGQAEINAAATFLQYPEVELVATAFLYMEIDKVVDKTFHRSQLHGLLTPSLATLQEISRSYTTGVWPKKRTGLCKFCVVKTCEHNPDFGKVST